MMNEPPLRIDLDKERGLNIVWADGSTSFYTAAHLRRNSPSADARELRKQLKSDPLAILPSGGSTEGGPLRAIHAELVGNYALCIHFSDGHKTGIYTWEHLRRLDPDRPQSAQDPHKNAGKDA